jgi:hypothetical protein
MAALPLPLPRQFIFHYRRDAARQRQFIFYYRRSATGTASKKSFKNL